MINPYLTRDDLFKREALSAADTIWEAVGPNFREVPAGYWETFNHRYESGNVSMCSIMDRVDLGPDATYQEYREVVEHLLEVDPDFFPEPGSILYFDHKEYMRGDQGISEDFEDFAEGEDLSHKMEMFLKKILATAYKDGISRVTDEDGNPPNQDNNYLLDEKGEDFRGVFHDWDSTNSKTKSFPFSISKKSGSWKINY